MQATSAQWLVRSLESPNAAREIGENLAAHGRYVAAYGERLWGPAANEHPAPRAYLLPAEPLYVAAGLTLLPAPLRRHLHLPVTTLLVLAVAYAATRFRGPGFGAAVGAWASLQPFVVAHGPVWDDTFLAGALVWLVVAVLIRQSSGPASSGGRRRTSSATLTLLAAAAGSAALARGEAQVLLMAIALAILVGRSSRTLSREAVALLAGVVVSLSAWGVRNQVSLGSFFVGSTHDGVTLWEANGPVTRQALLQGQVMALSLDPAIMTPHWKATAGRDEIEADAYFRKAAFRYVAGEPLEALKTVAAKVTLSLGGIRPEQSVRSFRNLGMIVWNVLVIGLAVYGWSTLRASLSPTVHSIFLVILGVALLTLAVGPVGMRYHVFADGVLWMAGAAGIQRLVRRRTSRSDATETARPYSTPSRGPA